jgi:hypothetical protein
MKTSRWVRIVSLSIFIVSLVPWFILGAFSGFLYDDPNGPGIGTQIFLGLLFAYPFYSVAGIVIAFKKANNYWLLPFVISIVSLLLLIFWPVIGLFLNV